MTSTTTQNAQQTRGTSMGDKTKVNGVDVGGLMSTLAAVKRQPELGAFEFRATNQWLDGMRNRSTIKSFYGAGKEDDQRRKPYVMDCDEPAVLTGTDQGANPVEYLLNALAGCMTTTMVVHAATRGVKIESVESALEGDIDIRGFTGLDANVTKGYEKIRVTFKVKSDATPQQLKELAQMSPVFNTITNPTPIEINVQMV